MSSPNLPMQDLSLDLREHGVCFVVPAGATIAGAEFDLPGGALVLGCLIGRVLCRSGSLIVPNGGQFSGEAEADQVYVDGRVFPSKEGRISRLKGRRLVAIGERAEGSADLHSQAFAVHTNAFSASFTTLRRVK